MFAMNLYYTQPKNSVNVIHNQIQTIAFKVSKNISSSTGKNPKYFQADSVRVNPNVISYLTCSRNKKLTRI